jgi:hypothetical protein
MRKRLFFLSFVLTFINFFCSMSTQPVEKEADQQNEEKLIYQTVMDSMFSTYSPQTLVLLDSTDMWDHIDSSWIKTEIPSIEGSIIAKFLENGKSSVPLKPLISLNINTVFLSAGEFREIFTAGGWDAFYDRYPNSGGLMSLSRIALNSSETQALLYVSNQWHYLAGMGQLFYLNKHSAWKIEKILICWVS